MRGPCTKVEFYCGWRRMQFGNRVRMWDSLEQLAGYSGRIAARSKTVGGPCLYGVLPRDAPPNCMYNEAPPDSELLLQGEMCRTTCGLALFSSTVKEPMRRALVHGVQVYGLAAKYAVEAVANSKSCDMLFELLDTYPDAVVEFGVYGVCLGELPGHNAIVWEVREY